MNENDDLEKLDKKYEEALNFGKQLQIEGMSIVAASERGKEITAYIRKSGLSPDMQSWVVRANATIPSCPPNRISEIHSYALTVGTSTSSGDAIFCLEIPLNQFEPNKSKELDDYLKAFSDEYPGIGDLVKMRKGAWDALSSVVENNLMGASHLMREIIRKVISKFATNEEVKKAEWWIKPKETKNEVVVKQRFRFLIFGTSIEDGEAKVEMVDETVNKCFEAYQRLQDIAHGSTGLKEEVVRCFYITEQTLLTIFRFKELSGA